MRRGTCREEGFDDVESATVATRLKLKGGSTSERLPPQVGLLNSTVVVVAHERSSMCLRCRMTGHVRRQCRVPRCYSCLHYGHNNVDCVKTYATMTRTAAKDQEGDLVMDNEDAEATAGMEKYATRSRRQHYCKPTLFWSPPWSHLQSPKRRQHQRSQAL